jgi:hypothetical protein
MAADAPPPDVNNAIHALVDLGTKGLGMADALYLYIATGGGLLAVAARTAWARYRAGRDVSAVLAKLTERLDAQDKITAQIRADIAEAKHSYDIATGVVTGLMRTIESNTAQAIRERAEIMALLTTLIAKE